jgi:hypothetical protein
MITIVADENESVIRCPSPTEFNFDVNIEEIETILSSASIENVEINDGLFERNTSSNLRIDGQINYIPISGPSFSPKLFSENSDLATVDSSGRITTVSSGMVDIFCRALQVTKKQNHSARFVSPTVSDVFLNYLSGTLGKHATEAVDGFIASGGALNLFSVKNNQSLEFQRSASCWLSSLNWTGVSPSNSEGGYQRGGTLVSPKHLILANHFNIPNGATVLFVTDNNVVVSRTISNSVQVSGSDIRVGILNNDVGEGVSFYSVLPNNWRDYLATVSQTYLPLVSIDQDQNIFCRELVSISVGLIGEAIVHRNAILGDRQNFTQSIVSGDSGQPLFLLINNTPVFFGIHYTSTSASRINKYITEINAAMTTLGGGYQLTEADLSGFTDFSS